jgi:hypothetical protein
MWLTVDCRLRYQIKTGCGGQDSMHHAINHMHHAVVWRRPERYDYHVTVIDLTHGMSAEAKLKRFLDPDHEFTSQLLPDPRNIIISDLEASDRQSIRHANHPLPTYLYVVHQPNLISNLRSDNQRPRTIPEEDKGIIRHGARAGRDVSSGITSIARGERPCILKVDDFDSGSILHCRYA